MFILIIILMSLCRYVSEGRTSPSLVRIILTKKNDWSAETHLVYAKLLLLAILLYIALTIIFIHIV